MMAINGMILIPLFLKPLIGNDKVMRDPSMVQGPDGTFHLVWTQQWRGDKGFGMPHQKILSTGVKSNMIPVMEMNPR